MIEGSTKLPLITLRQLQLELKPWQAHNFPNRQPVEPLLGVAEETGELCHAHLKGVQKIRHTPEEVRSMKEDAVADIIVYLADYCNAEGIDLEAALFKTWSKVKQRDWQKNKLDADKKVDNDITVADNMFSVVCPLCNITVGPQEGYYIGGQLSIFHRGCAEAVVRKAPDFMKPAPGIQRPSKKCPACQRIVEADAARCTGCDYPFTYP